jgi:hypothetical protein
MAPKLEQVFTLRASLGKEDTLPLGSVKGGAHRIVVPVTGGFIKGSDLEAEILPGGGDWLLLDPVTGTAHLDIRFQARSSSGDMIYGHYPGEWLIIDCRSEVKACWKPCQTQADNLRLDRRDQDGFVHPEVPRMER